VRLSWVFLSGRADDVVPSHFNFDRYAPMLHHSPFAVGLSDWFQRATDLDCWRTPRRRKEICR